MASIYIHIPFCERICSYCDFPKRVSKSSEIDRYLDALEKEFKMYSIEQPIDTLYVGGGTPSILSISQLKKLAKIIKKFKFAKEYEFTIECNPEHITKEKVVLYQQLGVNRVSLGVQTFHERHLKLLNRYHKKESVFNAVSLIKNQGISNISIDLIYAIPFQTLNDLKTDLRLVKELDIPHISAYSLILEEKTVFEKWLLEDRISLVDNEIEAKMYQFVINSLKDMGYHHYEVSNFAKSQYESKHNKVYWKNKEYYGFGMGASGYLNNVRYYNENMISKYIERIYMGKKPILSQEIVTEDEKIKEEFLLGLRLLNGINIEEVNKKYDLDILEYFKNQLKYLKSKNWISIEQNIKLTNNGLLFGNEVFELFI